MEGWSAQEEPLAGVTGDLFFRLWNSVLTESEAAF